MPRIKLRRTTRAAIPLDDPVPLQGEAVIVTDAQEILIGDGETTMSQLVPWAGPGAYALAGHAHSDLIAADVAAVEALANHAAQYLHETKRTERIYVPLTPAGGTLDDDAVIYFPWPASGHVRAITAMARTAPAGSAASFALKAADTWGGTLAAVASPVSIAIGAHAGTQDTISSPDVLADGVGAVEITADSGATAADVALLIDLEHAVIQRVPRRRTGSYSGPRARHPRRRDPPRWARHRGHRPARAGWPASQRLGNCPWGAPPRWGPGAAPGHRPPRRRPARRRRW